MNEADARREFINQCKKYVGVSARNKEHLQFISRYNEFIRNNAVKKANLPRSTMMVDGWAWCATYASAMGIEFGYGMQYFPVEMSCTRIIDESKEMGIWCEDESNLDAYKEGNWIIYDWQDGSNYATTDNKGEVDHVGIIVSVSADTVTVIEGNYSNCVKYRNNLQKNGRYIRGIVCPNFAAIAADRTPKTEAEPKQEATAEPQKSNVIEVDPLAQKCKGNAVKSLQALLNAHNGAGLEVDGSFGKLTKAAVINWQKKCSLPETGEANVETIQRLWSGK